MNHPPPVPRPRPSTPFAYLPAGVQGMAEPNFHDLRNVTIVLFVVAFSATSYRCFARYAGGIWWHDDSVALFSALSFIIYSIGCTYIADGSPSLGGIITGYYLVIVGFCVPIWGARVSIVLTVVRITPWELQRKILLWVTAFFVLEFVVMTGQAFLVCEVIYTGWKQIPGSVCILPRFVPISLVVMTVISDAILVATPLMVSRGVHIRALSFRLFSIFSMSVVTTLASLVHAVLVISKPGVWEGIFGAVSVAVAIIVSNMSVIIPAILRALDVGDPFMQEDSVDPNFSTIEMARATSTTIGLGLPKTRGTAVTENDESEGAISMVTFGRQDSGDLGPKDDHKHRLTMQVSDISLGSSNTKVVPLADESDTAGSLAKGKNLPPVENGLDTKADV